MNIDKDIERLKELKDIKVAINSAFYSTGRFELDEEDKQAIENVLKELEIKDKMIDKICSDIALDFGYDKEDVKIRYRKLVEKDE